MTHALIVDDHPENLSFLQTLLSAHGWTVDLAHHGAEALARARSNLPDLIVSDLLMPVMDGYTLLRECKADERLRPIPFVVYTATYTESQDEELALALGADAFVLKPSEPEALMNRIGAVLRSAAGATGRPESVVRDNAATFKAYSETLVRKLQEKCRQLEEVNRSLQEDIRRRQRMEEELRQSEERFRATFEHAAVGMAHVSLAGTFLRVNERLCGLTGYTRDELLGLRFQDLTLPEERTEAQAAHADMLAGRQDTYATDKRYRRKDGSVVWLGLVTTMLRSADGQPRYFASVFIDITARKSLEEQFLRAQRLESIGALASGIAHDLSNLFSPILMSVPLLAQNCTGAAERKMLRIIEANVMRGSDMVRQVLSFARGVQDTRGAVDLKRVVADLTAMVETTFPKRVRLRVEMEPAPWSLEGNVTQINQVLLNLCVNARDAMPTGGELTVRVRNRSLDAQFAVMHGAVGAGRYVALEVSDTGQGIPPAIVDRIFDPFFTTKPPGKGTGLGLSTVQAIVRAHGGGITVRSEPGQGSTFEVFLPAGGPSDREALDAAAREPGPRGHGELVMIVDDEASIRTIVQHTLERFGYRTLAAEDGAHAIGLYAQRFAAIAVVLTDMMMPVMDGRALITALRRINPDVQVIASTGVDEMQKVATPEIGVPHWLPKPYTVEALLVMLEQVLGAADKRNE